jgi:type I restriction enzyme M protein
LFSPGRGRGGWSTARGVNFSIYWCRFGRSGVYFASTMAIKKSEVYSSLWSSCDELRGGMDASQYKDYVLVLLFIKYVSDKYDGVPYAPITIPPGAGFKDMVALKGKPDIGDQINKKIIAPLMNANKLSDFPDFNDATKLGSGKEMVDRLTNLIAIFQNPALDFPRTAPKATTFSETPTNT